MLLLKNLLVLSGWHSRMHCLNKIRETLGLNGGTAEKKHTNSQRLGFYVVPVSSAIPLFKGIIFNSACINASAKSILTRKGATASEGAAVQRGKNKYSFV